MVRASLVLLATYLLPCSPAVAQARYERPPQLPQQIVDCLLAPPPPLVSVSPDHKTLLLVQIEGMPDLATVASPVLELAGRRVDPKTRGGRREHPLEW